MEIILLLIYSGIVWLVFFKYKLLPWNIVSQVIVVTLPVLTLAIIILLLNIVAPSSHDVRVLNYVVQVVPRVSGRVTEVPVSPNVPVKKGDVLFRIDPTPFEAQVRALESQKKLADRRLEQMRTLASAGAGTQFDLEEAEAKSGSLEAQLAEARWRLTETTVYAPTSGRVVNLQLRPGSAAAQFPLSPAMSFVEDEQWVIALFHQNELRCIEPGNEAEIHVATHPNRIIKCKVDSVIWASGIGQLPISGTIPQTGSQPIKEGRFAVRLKVDDKDKDLFLAAGAQGAGAIYTNHGALLHIIRKVMLRVSTKWDLLIVKLH
jgi:multidrug resistance efflux pump